jgi:excisionase family DNA binding protein
VSEFYNFDEALKQLNLQEEELKRLVSEGEIRAFRDGETMKLRRADVENLKTELIGGDLVEMDTKTEELVFEDDLGLDEAGMATEELSDMDTLLAEDVDDIAIPVLDVDIEDVGEVGVDDDDYEDRPVVTQRVAEEEEVAEGMGMRLLAIGTTAILFLGMPIVISLVTGQASDVAGAIAGLFGAELP